MPATEATREFHNDGRYYATGLHVFKSPERGKRGSTMGFRVCECYEADHAAEIARCLNEHSVMEAALGRIARAALNGPPVNPHVNDCPAIAAAALTGDQMSSLGDGA